MKNVETVKNYAHYTQLMRNGFYDKLFFIDKLFEGWDTLVDYGCADGFQTKLIGKIFRDKRIIGYDDSDRMITMASYTGEKLDNVNFTKRLPLSMDVLYLSSVIHEILNYATPDEIETFWNYTFENTEKYIIIRDMIYDAKDMWNISIHQNKIIVAIEKYCRIHQKKGELDRFTQIYGSLNSPKNIIHFLLKYDYMDSPNWNRELMEDYLPISFQQFKTKVPKDWDIFYYDNTPLPYFKHKWNLDFGLNLNIKTHSKIILKKKQ